MRWLRDEAPVSVGQHPPLRLAWRRAGGGRPLLYLHDAGADTLASPVFDDLATDHEVVLVDLPGYGRSDPGAGLGSPCEVGTLLGALVARLGWEAATVAGTSLGGWFAAETALAAPGRVSALLLADSAGLHVPEEYLFALFAAGAAARAAANNQQRLAGALVARLGDPAVRSEEDLAALPPAQAAAVVGPMVQEMAAAAASSWDPHTLNPRLLGLLPRIAAPTTVLWGERDALIPMTHARAFAQAIPGARLTILRGHGHLLALEAPDAFAGAVRRTSALGWS